MRVSVFGLGYVGCVTAACLAKSGHEVVGVDVNEDKVVMVNDAVPPVIEPGLGELLVEMVEKKRLRATTCSEDSVEETDLALICVGTPSLTSGRLDVGAVERAGREIGSALRRRRKPYTVVVRSTVLPGTTEQVLIPSLLEASGRDLGPSLQVAVNPEFMREGSSLEDFRNPTFTLAGAQDPRVASLIRSLYADITAAFIHTEIRTAEMVKYVSNAFHALKICFANEIGSACMALGVDAQEVMRIFMTDRKLNISKAYLRPGFAFGGSCLPKDLRALLYAVRSADLSVPLLSSILPSNGGQIHQAIEAVIATKKKRVGVIGLSFKPGTDDLRESPMVALVEALIGKGCAVRILDKNVSVARLVGANRRYIEQEIPHIASLLCEDVEAVLSCAEVVVLGNASAEAALALSSARPEQIVIDLTRGALQRLD